MERSVKAGSQLDFYPRKMLFLFPRRCIRTIGISREEIEDVTSRSRDRLVAGKHLQLTYARNTCVFSASRLRAATLLPFLRCPPRFFRRELAPASIVRNAAAKQLETATRFHPRTSDPSNLNFPLFSAPHPANSFESRRKGQKGEDGFARLEKSCSMIEC